jgi:hypothetical protein
VLDPNMTGHDWCRRKVDVSHCCHRFRLEGVCIGSQPPDFHLSRIVLLYVCETAAPDPRDRTGGLPWETFPRSLPAAGSVVQFPV